MEKIIVLQRIALLILELNKIALLFPQPQIKVIIIIILKSAGKQ